MAGDGPTLVLVAARRDGVEPGRARTPAAPTSRSPTTGREQARRLGTRLAGREFALVLTSPLARARETCELAGLGDRAQVEPDLQEFDYGEYEGITTRRDPRDAAGLEPVARRRARRRAAGGRRRPRRPRDRPRAGGRRRRRAVRPRTRAARARRPLDRAAGGATAATSPSPPRRCPSWATSASAARSGCGTTPATCDRRDGAPARRAGPRRARRGAARAARGPARRRDARRRAHAGAGARLGRGDAGALGRATASATGCGASRRRARSSAAAASTTRTSAAATRSRSAGR